MRGFVSVLVGDGGMSGYMKFDADIEDDAFWMAVGGHRRCELMAEHLRRSDPYIAKRIDRLGRIFARIAKHCAEREKGNRVQVDEAIVWVPDEKDEEGEQGCSGV